MKSEPQSIEIDSYDYPLPESRIANHPLEQRDACLLLEAHADGRLTDHIFNELPWLLQPGSLLVYNNTRVINARLKFVKSTGGVIEIFCLEPAEPADYARNFESTESCVWKCLVGNSKRWKEGVLSAEISIDGHKETLNAERLGAAGDSWLVRLSWTGGYSFARIIEAAGEIPIPPYLGRGTEASDSTDYQTIYSHIDGSVAAPTAGLHFTPALLDALDARGINRREVTLHVGAGTFRPVKSATIGEHPMHSEFIEVDLGLIEELADAVGKRPIVAVGTTSVRTLESLYHIGCLASTGLWDGELEQWYPYSASRPGLSAAEALRALADMLRHEGKDKLVGSTRIIIAPGYDYRIVDAMITNFHQPRSTLLLLVSAFLGEDRWRPAYDHALAGDYRFLSYGDACLLIKN